MRPHIATGGLLKEGAIPKLKAMSFTSVVDLRGPDEGTASEKEAVESAGLRYFNISVTNRMLPTDFQIAEFARIINVRAPGDRDQAFRLIATSHSD